MIKINKLFSNLLFLVITVSFFSCSQLRYTNYGKPLDFLKANRIAKAKTSIINSDKDKIKENNISKINTPNIDKYVEKSNLNNLIEELNVTKDVELKKEFITLNNKINKKNIDNSISIKSLIKIKNILNTSNIVNIEKLHKKASLYSNSANDLGVEELLILILCLLLPPLAVFLIHGVETRLFISLILTCLFWIPGVIYALLVCF